MKCLSVWVLHYWLYQKFQIDTRRWWGKWRNFRIFSKKVLIYIKLLFFLKKHENFSIFPSSVCVWTIIICSNLNLLVQPRYAEPSQTLKHFIFSGNVLVYLFPTNISYFRQKRLPFLKKESKRGGKQTNSKIFFGKQTKWKLLSNMLFQIQQGPNRKKVIPFWRLPL